MTLIVNGTCETELRTRFWPRRFTYSVITGSLTIFDCDSTCWENALPMAICFSRLYQLPIPRSQPTCRLPIASTSLLPPSCSLLGDSEGAAAGGCEGVVDVADGVWLPW